MSNHPELLKQMALEVIARIPLDAAKIYTDGMGPFSCRPSWELSCGRPCEGGHKQSCGSGKPHGSYID
ncbi:hypothetical protein TNCV_4904871 [Trichonephila clavipes]|uniref:Uncharacterized protein n=1 Tax=Trichonephila clavipes TaxID=2585209 RepID=A0A8X6RUP0_TRICX|nr:hypothetical protein TNCV_4904871 [Trichonephila clavipes]